MYNNIKNFVKPQYAALFLVCIGCLLLLIFTKSRIEGARGRRGKNTTNLASQNTAKINNLQISDNRQNDAISKLNSRYDEMKKQLDNKGNTLSAESDIIMKTIDSKSGEVLAQNASILQKLDLKEKDILKNVALKEKEISDSLYNQSIMFKTGLQNDASKFKTNSDEVSNIINIEKGKTVEASEKAKEYSELAEDMYKNMAGTLTYNSVKTATEQPNTSKQTFTTMFSGTNFVPNTGYYETFVQREQFDTALLQAKPANPPLLNAPSLNALTEDVVAKINAFNAAYAVYVQTPSESSATKTAKLTLLQDANTNLATSLTNLQNAYPLKTDKTTDNKSYMDDATFKSEHAVILEKSKQIDVVRQELDAKMENILKGRSPQNDFTNEYDSTVYTGVLWSILGTSLLYYIFTEL
jgi:hypothetical protein